MADSVDPERLQGSRAWKDLTASLGVRTPRKLAGIAAATKAIRQRPRGRTRKG